MTNYRSKSTLALAAMIALPVLSWAGTAEKAKAADAPAEKINSSAITGDIGVGVYSSMYSRGQILAKHSPTILPYIDLFATAYEGDGFLNKAVLSLNVTEYYTNPGTFRKKPAISSGNNAAWYENDFVPGIALTFGKLTVSESYHLYLTPNDTTAGTFKGLNSSISYDDGDLLGAFALHPSVTYMQCTYSHGSYFEGAVSPGFSSGDVAVAIPLTIGFFEDNFGGTGKNGFAYFSAGVKVTYTLPMPKTYGTWAANIGATYYSKDTKVTEAGRFTDGVKDDDISLSAGIQVNF
jgi:hypothetical protein